MGAGSGSLLHSIDAPLLVGDPDGQIVYLNPCFERSFSVAQVSVLGQPLAALFEGGAREAVLGAFAKVCGGEGSVRFRLLESGRGYAALASPISEGGDRVGVVILLTEEHALDDRLLAKSRDLQGPIDELTRCLGDLADQVGGRRSAGHRQLLEDAVSAVETLRKDSDDLQRLLSGGGFPNS